MIEAAQNNASRAEPLLGDAAYRDAPFSDAPYSNASRHSSAPPHPVVVIGAGPAGLTAAYELAQRGVKPLVLEKHSLVGGIARTEAYRGYRFDIGGHRFYTKVEEVENLWREVLGAQFQSVPRLSRIFYNGDFFDYPLSLKNTLGNLGAIESACILLSYLRWKILPYRKEETFAHWVTNRFGRRLYRKFFKTYTEKVWGISCDEIQAEWAAQRIRGLSLSAAVLNAVLGTHKSKSLIKTFEYPTFGPGQMWERFAEEIEARGGEVEMQSETICIRHEGKRIREIVAQQIKPQSDNRKITKTIAAEHLISTMPISELLQKLEPAPPKAVLAAAQGLKYRALILVGIIIDEAELFPDNWIYIHSPQAKVGRIQNFKNWSAAMVPNAEQTSLGMEYFCSEGDDIWQFSDEELIALATREIAALGLADAEKVCDGIVIRQPKAYPVYDATYRAHLEVLREYLARFSNLQTIGRNGMHRYNNQDHSMLTGLLAAQNLCGENHDLWEVNTERSYYEDFSRGENQINEKPDAIASAIS